MRTFGVEEELLLVDAVTALPVPRAEQLLARDGGETADGSPTLTAELQQEMVEVVSEPQESLDALLAQIRAGRRMADDLAIQVGARALPLAMCPVSVQPHPTDNARYQEMMRRYGVTARESLTCGLHVHTSIESDEEGVAVLDRIRVWVPLLIALSANSPFHNGRDTGYSSYRSVSWRQWPSAGPTDVFGSLAAYRAYEHELLETGGLLDAGMLYFDARLSRGNPTVEVRVSDVCLVPETTAAIAAIVRALVETAADEWMRGLPAPPVSAAAIRLASWVAGRAGLRGDLVHPIEGRSQPARVAIDALLEHCGAALEDAGDLVAVRADVDRLFAEGTGAEWQRQRFAEHGDLTDVLRGAAS
jgi:glutamate---cysteine ligase / carboxylate-amine ligase